MLLSQIFSLLSQDCLALHHEDVIQHLLRQSNYLMNQNYPFHQLLEQTWTFSPINRAFSISSAAAVVVFGPPFFASP
ncbi:hypothetical protein AKJ16_DCAP06694 [Drosera capensis]